MHYLEDYLESEYVQEKKVVYVLFSPPHSFWQVCKFYLKHIVVWCGYHRIGSDSRKKSQLIVHAVIFGV